MNPPTSSLDLTFLTVGHQHSEGSGGCLKRCMGPTVLPTRHGSAASYPPPHPTLWAFFLRFLFGSKSFVSQPEPAPGEPAKLRPQRLPLSALPWSHMLQRQSLPRSPHGGSPTKVCSPDDRRLPLLPLMIFPLLPMLASLEVFSVPVSVRSIAISLRLRAAWILD